LNEARLQTHFNAFTPLRRNQCQSANDCIFVDLSSGKISRHFGLGVWAI